MQYSCLSEKETIQRDVCRDYNYERNCKSKISVVGRLNKSKIIWKNKLQVSNVIQKIIDEGYTIPSTSAPPAFYAKYNKSSLDNKLFVEEAIESS